MSSRVHSIMARPDMRAVLHARTTTATYSEDMDDSYDRCEESPLVDTVVEFVVILMIAALINIMFWGVLRFGVSESVDFLAEVA